SARADRSVPIPPPVSLFSPSSSPLNCPVLARERGKNRVEAVLHFGVGQRAVVRLERQTQRETDRSFRNALALIPIEDADVDERCRQRAGRRVNGATNDRRGQGV